MQCANNGLLPVKSKLMKSASEYSIELVNCQSIERELFTLYFINYAANDMEMSLGISASKPANHLYWTPDLDRAKLYLATLCEKAERTTKPYHELHIRIDNGNIIMTFVKHKRNLGKSLSRKLTTLRVILARKYCDLSFCL